MTSDAPIGPRALKSAMLTLVDEAVIVEFCKRSLRPRLPDVRYSKAYAFQSRPMP
jgi:hypothetical protein